MVRVHRPAGGASRRSSTAARRRRRRARSASPCRGVSFAYGPSDGRADDPPRHRPRDRRRPLGRRRRPHRQRQDDVLPAAAAPRRGDERHGVARRRADRRHPDGRAAPARRPRAPGGRAVRGHDPRQRDAVRPRADRRRRRSTRCGASGSAPLAAGGIHRPLGAGGAGLSAGEAQLLALARVWLRQPDLVVLDEATARIDPVTEQRLEAAVARADRRAGRRSSSPTSCRRCGWSTRSSCSTAAASSSTTTARCWPPTGGSRCRHLLGAGPRGGAGGMTRTRRTQAIASSAATLPIWRLAWRVSQHEPRSFWLGWAAFVVFFTMPALTGYLLAAASTRCPTATPPPSTGGRSAVAVAETLRMASVHFGAITWTKAWVAHADAAARQPADRPGGERRAGGRPARRLGRRGADPLPRRHRGRRHARRRHGRRLRRARVHGARRVPARRRPTPRGALVLLLPLAGVVLDDARARRADQGVPGRRPRGDGGRHRARRRPDGGGDDGQGQRRHRRHARPAARARRRPPAAPRCATACSTRA